VTPAKPAVTKIAVLGGTGALGAGLAARLARAGYDLRIGSRDPAKAEALAETLRGESGNAKVSGSGLIDAAEWAELSFLTVPYGAHEETLLQIREALQGKIFVDATVPLKPPAVSKVQMPAAGSAALETLALLGEEVKIVSALQNIGAQKLARPDPIDSDVLVTGNDAEAVETVRGVLADAGLDSIHAGSLANSVAVEAMTSLLIFIGRKNKIHEPGIRIRGSH
jgi:NADPH-dependent F420 reductase